MHTLHACLHTFVALNRHTDPIWSKVRTCNTLNCLRRSTLVEQLVLFIIIFSDLILCFISIFVVEQKPISEKYRLSWFSFDWRAHTKRYSLNQEPTNRRTVCKLDFNRSKMFTCASNADIYQSTNWQMVLCAKDFTRASTIKCRLRQFLNLISIRIGLDENKENNVGEKKTLHFPAQKMISFCCCVLAWNCR